MELQSWSWSSSSHFLYPRALSESLLQFLLSILFFFLLFRPILLSVDGTGVRLRRRILLPLGQTSVEPLFLARQEDVWLY